MLTEKFLVKLFHYSFIMEIFVVSFIGNMNIVASITIFIDMIGNCFLLLMKEYVC